MRNTLDIKEAIVKELEEKDVRSRD